MKKKKNFSANFSSYAKQQKMWLPNTPWAHGIGAAAAVLVAGYFGGSGFLGLAGNNGLAVMTGLVYAAWQYVMQYYYSKSKAIGPLPRPHI